MKSEQALWCFRLIKCRVRHGWRVLERYFRARVKSLHFCLRAMGSRGKFSGRRVAADWPSSPPVSPNLT